MDEATSNPETNIPARDAGPSCESCGGPHARRWSTSLGPAHLCPTCATLHGLGCP